MTRYVLPFSVVRPTSCTQVNSDWNYQRIWEGHLSRALCSTSLFGGISIPCHYFRYVRSYSKSFSPAFLLLSQMYIFSLSSLFCLFVAVGLRQVTKYRLRYITMNDNMEKSTHALLAFFNYGVVVAIVFENCGRKMIRKEEKLPEEKSLYWLA